LLTAKYATNSTFDFRETKTLTQCHSLITQTQWKGI